MSKYLPIIVFVFGLFSLWRAGDALAACYCVDPVGDKCSCTSTGGSIPVTWNGVDLRCDTAGDANSLFAVKDPLCSAGGWVNEVTPNCAFLNGDNTKLACWGTGFLLNYSSSNLDGQISTDGWQHWDASKGDVRFNGGSWQNVVDIWTCHENVTCCGLNCTMLGNPSGFTGRCGDGGGVGPVYPDYINACAAGPGGGYSKGTGESRIWFSQTRLVATLASMAQTLFNPFGLDEKPEDGNYNMASFSKNTPLSDTGGRITNQGGVTSRVEEHQGLDDATRVVNREDNSDNNSSVRVGDPAPGNLFGIGIGDDNPYNNDNACYIPETVDRVGDDLAGPKIVSQLVYTDAFSYTPKYHAPGCISDGGYFEGLPGGINNCCSGDASVASDQCVPNILGVCTFVPTPPNVRMVCSTLEPRKIETEASVKVFSKNPLLEHVYSVILGGTDSLYRRFMPWFDEKIEEVPTSTGFSADVTLAHSSNSTGAVTVEYAEGEADAPTLYVPRLGTLDKYWLEDFQTSIRPKGFARGEAAAPPVSPPNQNQITCSYSQSQVDTARNAAADKYGIPRSMIKAIMEIEGTEWIRDPDSYICRENSSGAAGIMQVIRAPERSNDTYTYVSCDNERLSEPEEFSSCTTTGTKLSRCDVDDIFELAARTIMWKAGLWNPATCSSDGKKFPPGPNNRDAVYAAACNYYGTRNSIKWPTGYLATLPNPLRSTCSGTEDVCMNYCDVVCNKMGICGPDYPLQK